MVAPTKANRRANPTAYQQLTTADGKLVLQLRNDMDRDEAVRSLRQIADRVELLIEAENTR